MGFRVILPETLKLNTFELGVWNNKPIEWQVLDVGSGILCISKYCLENRMFDEENNIWETSELRQWLNSDFFNKTFSPEEKSFLLPYEEDKVTLLSREEAEKYLPTKAKRAATDINERGVGWWLRSHNNSRFIAGYVYCDGDIYYNIVFHTTGYVRPVILLKRGVENF